MHPYAYRHLNDLAYRTVCELGFSSRTKITGARRVTIKSPNEIVILIYANIQYNIALIFIFSSSFSTLRDNVCQFNSTFFG